MKKTDGKQRSGGGVKGSAGSNEVDAYLAKVPEPARGTLQKVRAAIRSALPPVATEKISYGAAAFHYKGPVMGFAAFPNHCSLFVMDPAVMVEFEGDLAKFETSKGTIRFPLDKPPSAALVKKLAKARAAKNELRKRR